MSLLLSRVGGGGGAIAYSLTCASGSYTLTGNAASFVFGRKLPTAAGSYSYTGQAATLKRVYSLTCSAGAYSYTGVAASFAFGRKLAASAGAYSYTGNAATLKRSYALSAASGAYAITGQAATLTYSAGHTNYTLTCSAGSYAITGLASSLVLARQFPVSSGSYTLTGYAATLTYTPGTSGPIAYTITCLPGAYQVTGSDAVLSWSGENKAAGIPKRFWAKRKVTIKPPDEKPQEVVGVQEIIETVKHQALADALLTISKNCYNAPQMSQIVSDDEIIAYRVQLIYQQAYYAALQQKLAEIDEEEALIALLL